MSIRDINVEAYEPFARRPHLFYVATVPISQAAVLFAQMVPYAYLLSGPAPGVKQGLPPYATYGWVVEDVQIGASASANPGSINVDVQINAVSVLTSLPAAQPSWITGTLVAPALRRGKVGDQLNLRVTTGGASTITDLQVQVALRAFPMGAEVGG